MSPAMVRVLDGIEGAAESLRKTAKADKSEPAAMAALCIVGICAALRGDVADADELREYALRLAARTVRGS